LYAPQPGGERGVRGRGKGRNGGSYNKMGGCLDVEKSGDLSVGGRGHQLATGSGQRKNLSGTGEETKIKVQRRQRGGG